MMNQVAIISFSKSDTQAIKGIAVLLMILHHALLPVFYDNPPEILDNLIVLRLMIGGKFCVGLFAFITGYGYACATKHDWSYSWKHIKRLLSRYWILLFFVFVPLSIVGGAEITFLRIVQNMFGLNSSMNCANWYIYFYIFSMLTMPLLAGLLDKYPFRTLVSIILVCMFGIASSNYCEGMWGKALECCSHYLPVVAVGYITPWFKHNRIDSFLKNQSPLLFFFLAVIIFIMRSCVASFGPLVTDVVFAPTFVYCISKPFEMQWCGYLKSIMCFFGTLSIYIWFIHPVFFSTTTRSIIQSSVIWPNSILLVLILVILVSLVFSYGLMKIDVTFKNTKS